MAESIVSFAVERVRDLLIEEAKFLWEVEGQVKDMQKELKRIQCFLKDADRRQDEDEVIHNWVSEIRDIAYDAEDVTETYILKVTLNKEKAGSNYLKLLTGYLTKCVCVDVHKAGNEIVDIKSKISSLTASMQTYGIRPIKEGESLRSCYRKQQKTNQSHAHVEEDFVGMEDSIKDMVGEMVKRGRQHRVVSICGMGGRGKTSLAKKVYSHEEVRRNFDCFAWTCVSQQYQVKEILVEILIEFIPDQRKEILEMREQELLKTLYIAQQKKRCLVVLDDVWTTEAWDNLKGAFPMENTSSKILLTTRNQTIAKYVDPHCFVHEPRYLSEKESWELLMRKAFPGRADPTIHPEMERLGKNMLRQSGGLPLAVIVLGGVLAKKKTLSEWETVQRNIDLDLQKGRIEVSKVLALSYEDLPYHLKPCFLYFANFPEDVAIPARKLVHMWIAEGFFPSTASGGKGERTIEDVAEHSLNELVNRGLVQARVSKSTGKIKTCHLHDLMRDLCILKAKEENFLDVINLQKINETTDSSSAFKVRRLSIYLNGEDGIEGYPPSVTSKLGETSHLRALILFDPKGCGMKSWEQMQTLYLNYEFLRVLDLEGFYSLAGALPKSVGDLVHLRYLNLRNTRVEELPVSLGNLECMETLDLRVSRAGAVLVPDVLWKMKRLKYLYLPLQFSVRGSEKLQLHSLKHLETLKNFSPTMCEVKDLEKLTNLRRLTFCPLEGTEGLEQVLKLGGITLKRIRCTSFKITWTFPEPNLGQLSGYRHPCNLFLQGSIQKLPEDKHFPNRIRKLILKKSKLEEDPMPKLEKLQNLIVLHLLEDAFMVKEMACSSQGFPQLRSLLLSELSCLEGWKVAEGALACLSHLGVANCARMRRVVPEGLSFVADRQKLDFVYVAAGNRGRFRVVREGKRWVYHRDNGVVVREVQAERDASAEERKSAEEWMLDYAPQQAERDASAEERKSAEERILDYAPQQAERDASAEERKSAEEWMLDYALQQVTSKYREESEEMEADVPGEEETEHDKSLNSDDFNTREQKDPALERDRAIALVVETEKRVKRWIADVPGKEETEHHKSLNSDDYNLREQKDPAPEPETGAVARLPGQEQARRGFRARLLPVLRVLQFISLLRALPRFNPRQ
ncbi:hypothetical protein CDL15_Pgr027984 [Punica granatum]|uniref:Disease resistance protein At1g50180 n=1 Tax=Punica granatum TaxID=22663 RepID=A0A218XJR2_PUNGR|nr:hypothetical protein CDL15_Pgr027984 [Punica granatum]